MHMNGRKRPVANTNRTLGRSLVLVVQIVHIITAPLYINDDFTYSSV